MPASDMNGTTAYHEFKPSGLLANLLAKRQVCTNIDGGMFRVQGDLLDQTTFQERQKFRV